METQHTAAKSSRLNLDIDFQKQLDIARELTTPDGFNSWFEFFYSNGNRNQEEAYDYTCILYMLIMNRNPPYSGFNSFKVCRSKQLKKFLNHSHNSNS